MAQEAGGSSPLSHPNEIPGSAAGGSPSLRNEAPDVQPNCNPRSAAAVSTRSTRDERSTDAAAGRDAYAAAKPVIADVSEALKPARPDAATCALLRLGAPPPYAFPKTVGRFNAVKVVCGK